MSDRDRLAFQLSYGDCDAMGIAYFAIYYPWLDRTYTAWLHSHGLRSGVLEPALGIATVGVRSAATDHRTPKVFDELVCQAVLDRIGTTSYPVGYEVTADGELVTRGQMTYACRDGAFAKAPVPERLAEVLRTLPAPRFATG